MPLPIALCLLTILCNILAPLIEANCECGYTLNTTLYTDLLETDFLHLADITKDTDWQPQDYTITPDSARGPYGKNASLTNVRVNPLKSQYDWAGDGMHGGDAGLQLIVRGGFPTDALVPMAEVATARRDLLFGTFRVGMKVTGTSGTCGAFFWYFNDTQEIDMEFLSKDFNNTSNPVDLVLQSPASEEAGFDAANTGTFKVHELPHDPSGAFHEYRFDWSPDSVSFYADGALLDTMNEAVPTSAGHITLSHWSNGDPDWSGGPPTTDAILTVEYVKGYFNSSDPSRQKDWQERCKDPSTLNATCAIPETTEAPNGNMSARTFFFSMQLNSTVNQTVFGTKKKSEGDVLNLSPWKRGLLAKIVSLQIMLWVFQWGLW